MISEGELRLISLWTMPTTLDPPNYTVLLYCMMKLQCTILTIVYHIMAWVFYEEIFYEKTQASPSTRK